MTKSQRGPRVVPSHGLDSAVIRCQTVKIISIITASTGALSIHLHNLFRHNGF